MKVKDIRDRLAVGGGRLDIAEGVRATGDAGKDVDFYGNNGMLIAYVPSSHKDDEEVRDAITVVGAEAFRCAGDIAKLGQYFGIPVQGVVPITVTKEGRVKDDVELNRVRNELERTKQDKEKLYSEKDGARRAFESVVEILADKLKD